MANTIVQLRRSNTSASPGTILAAGELAYSYNTTTQALYIGSNSGVGSNPILIAGQKYNWLQQANTGTPGAQAANATVITDGNSFVYNVFSQGLILGATVSGPAGNATMAFVNSISNTGNSTQLGANASGGGIGTELATTAAITAYVIAKTGGAAVGGSNTQIQYNNSGNFAGDADFTFDSATNIVHLGNNTTGTIDIGNSTVNSIANQTTYIIRSSTTANTTIDSTQVFVANSTTNTVMNLSGVRIGNTTVNAFSNSTAKVIQSSATVNTTIDSTQFFAANSTTNTVVNTVGIRIGNTTVNSFANSTGVVIQSSATVNTTIDSTQFFAANSSTNTVMNTVGVRIGNTTVNTFANSTGIVLQSSSTANTTLSSSQVFVANSTTNTVMNTVGLLIGNTTQNAFINSTALVIQSNTTVNTTITPTSLRVGNATVNLTFSSGTLDVRATNTNITSNVTITGANLDATSAFLKVQQAQISGNLTVQGNLTVTGTLTSIDTTNIVVQDPIIITNDGGTTTDTADFGVVSYFGNSTVTQVGGLVRKNGGAAAGYANTFLLFTSQTAFTNTSTSVPLDANLQLATLQSWIYSSANSTTTGKFVSNTSGLTITANSTWAVALTANTLSLSTQLPVTSGGTGLNSVVLGGVLLGNTTSAMVVLSPSSNGQVLQVLNSAGAGATDVVGFGGIDGGTF